MSSKYNWKFLLTISLVSAMGGYLFGFDFAVITGGLPFLRAYFNLNAYWEGFTTGSLALGCIAGCLIAGRVADKYGRKPGLLAPLTWVLISEIFPNNIRVIGVSIAVIALWTAYFILVFTFPLIEKHFGDAFAFWGYAIICVMGFLFIYFKLPETKGKSLETIENESLYNRVKEK
jgi:MFS family permease